MKKKRFLTFLTLAFLTAGLLLFIVPFIKSMNPSDSAGSQLPHFDVSSLSPGEFFLSENFGEIKYLILKDYDSRIYAYWFPVKDNRIIMPDMHWWRWGSLCKSFGPDAVNGKIVKGGIIQCHDNIPPETWSSEWRWTYDGKNLGKYTADMESVKFTIEGRYLIAGKSSKDENF